MLSVWFLTRYSVSLTCPTYVLEVLQSVLPRLAPYRVINDELLNHAAKYSLFSHPKMCMHIHLIYKVSNIDVGKPQTDEIILHTSREIDIRH